MAKCNYSINEQREVINMKNNHYFKPTPLYKEFMILDLIEKNSKITQRIISDTLGIAVSMVNSYIDGYEEKGFVRRKYLSTKTVEYFITKKGIERKKVLNIGFLKSSQTIYDLAKNNIERFLTQIIDKGFKKVILYGAGEVAEIMLQVISTDKMIPIDVVAVIDDDVSKIGNTIVNRDIIALDDIDEYQHDGVMISSYTNNVVMQKKLYDIGYDKDKVLSFFD